MQIIRSGNITWINLEKPGKKDCDSIRKHYNLHPLIIDEITRSTYRPKVEDYGHFLYLVLHFPVYDPRDSSHGKEIDFIIGKDFLITIQYQKMPPLESFLKACQTDKDMKEKCFSDGPGMLLYYLLTDLYSAAGRELDKIDRKISQISNKIFKEEYRRNSFVKELSALKHEIIDFRRAINPQESIIVSLESHAESFFGRETAPYFRTLVGSHFQLQNVLENHKEVIDTLHHTNTSLITTRTNEITKNLTIMAFITFPLTLFASIFGMNTVHNPIIGHSYDFWIIAGVMAFGVIIMFEYFKYKRWL